MTDEGKSETENWIEKKGATYAYAYDKRGQLKSWFGIKGIPHAVLVDPSGTIVWRGHPMSLQEGTLRAALTGALEKPVWEWPASASKAAKALADGRFARAVAAAEDLGADGAPIVRSLRALIDGRVASLRRLRDAGDWLAVSELGAELAGSLEGLPQLEEVRSVQAALDESADAKRILSVQLEIRRAMDGRLKKAERQRIEKRLREILQELPGTAAARDAQRALACLG